MRKYIPHVIIAVLMVFIVYQCESEKEIKRLSNANIDALTDSVKHYENRLGSQTASIKTLQLEKNQLQEYVLEKDEELAELAKEFSDIKQVVKYETVTQFDTIAIVYNDTVPCQFERSDTKTAEWYSFHWKSNQRGMQIDSLKTWTTATVISGTKRNWFLGPETLTTDITFSNPHVTVTDITAAEVVIKQPWYKKWWLWLLAGFTAGIGLSL